MGYDSGDSGIARLAAEGLEYLSDKTPVSNDLLYELVRAWRKGLIFVTRPCDDGDGVCKQSKPCRECFLDLEMFELRERIRE